MKLTFISLLLILCVETSFSSQKVSALSSNVARFGDEYIVLARTYYNNSVAYGVFETEPGNYWAFKEGDLIHLKSITIKVLNIDTLTQTVELSQIAFVSSNPDTNYLGYWVNNGGYDLLDGGALRMISNASNSVTFRYYSLDKRKYYLFEEDTCIIDGTRLVYLRLHEQTIPVVNCRDILIKDTSISLEKYRFFLEIPCFSKYIDVVGDAIGTVLELEIKTGDFSVSEYLIYKGSVDSSEVTLKLGEKFIDQKNNQIFSFEWSLASGVYQFAGFKVYHDKSSGVKISKSSKIQTPLKSESYFYNCLGMKQIKKKKANGLLINAGTKKVMVAPYFVH